MIQVMKEFVTPPTKWIGKSWTGQARFEENENGNSWVVSKVLREYQEREPFDPQGYRHTIYIAECTLDGDPESLAILTCKMQVPNLFSTLPAELQDDSYLESPQRHLLLQYTDAKAYRNNVLQMRTENPRIFSDQALSGYHHMKIHHHTEVLEALLDCSCAPQIFTKGDWAQAEDEWVPGGFAHFFLTKPPSKNICVNVNDQWNKWTKRERQIITTRVMNAWKEICTYGVTYAPNKENVVVDQVTGKVFVTSVFDMTWRNNSSEGNWEDGDAHFARTFRLEPPDVEPKQESMSPLRDVL